MNVRKQNSIVYNWADWGINHMTYIIYEASIFTDICYYQCTEQLWASITPLVINTTVVLIRSSTDDHFAWLYLRVYGFWVPLYSNLFYSHMENIIFTKTSSTPPLFIGGPVQCQESEYLCTCLLRVLILPLFLRFVYWVLELTRQCSIFGFSFYFYFLCTILSTIVCNFIIFLLAIALSVLLLFGHFIVCPSSFGHCIVCPSSFGHCIVCPSFGHCVVCPSSIYGFWITRLVSSNISWLLTLFILRSYFCFGLV